MYSIVLVRVQRDRRIREYVARRTRESRNIRENMRCPKRGICREVCRALTSKSQPAPRSDFTALRKAKGMTPTALARELNP